MSDNDTPIFNECDVEDLTIDFADNRLSAPTQLELEVGHDIDDDEEAYISAARSMFGVDAKQAAAGYQLYYKLRSERDLEE